jgi:hypothetical protein
MMEETEGASILVGDIEAQLTYLFDDPDFNAIHQKLSPFTCSKQLEPFAQSCATQIFSDICYRRAGRMV